MKAIVLFFLSIAFPSGILLAQSMNYYPDMPSTYFYNMASANPGFVPNDAKADFVTGYKFRTGAFKDISTFTFTGAKVFRQENGSAHVLRLLLNNEQEGPYINTPKMLLNYAYTLRIDENTALFSGLAMGGTGIYFSAPSATTSILMPDGTLGLGINHRKVSFGFSSFQLFNSTVSPLLSIIRLARYYHLNFNAEKELGLDWKLNAYALWRFLPKVTDEVSISTLFTFKEAFAFGASYKNNAGMSFFTTFHVNTGNDKFLISFAYNTPAFSPIPRFQNSMEICLGYQFLE